MGRDVEKEMKAVASSVRIALLSLKKMSMSRTMDAEKLKKDAAITHEKIIKELSKGGLDFSPSPIG